MQASLSRKAYSSEHCTCGPSYMRSTLLQVSAVISFSVYELCCFVLLHSRAIVVVRSARRPLVRQPVFSETVERIKTKIWRNDSYPPYLQTILLVFNFFLFVTILFSSSFHTKSVLYSNATASFFFFFLQNSILDSKDLSDYYVHDLIILSLASQHIAGLHFTKLHGFVYVRTSMQTHLNIVQSQFVLQWTFEVAKIIL